MTDFKTIPTQPTLGLGCWAIGGPFFSGDTALGWGEVDDTVSTKAIETALDHGIRHFDTAQAYGTGHSETLLGAAVKGRDDVAIATKVGLATDPIKQQLLGLENDPVAIRASIDVSRQRLQRDQIDLVLLHPNETTMENAGPIFDMLETLVDDGLIGTFGWSTDFPDKAEMVTDRPKAHAIEFAMNVFFRADHIVPIIEDKGAVGLIRSPLAMGLLGGKYDAKSTFANDDVRNLGDATNSYFKDGKITESALTQLNAIREILRSDGRSLAQGAISWLWARSENVIPIPGFRTPEQVTDLCGALEHGPLTSAQMEEIEFLIERPKDDEPRAR